jgi:hypothetical protein
MTPHINHLRQNQGSHLKKKSCKIQVLPSLQVEKITNNIFLNRSQFPHQNQILLRMYLFHKMFQLQKGIKHPNINSIIFPLQISQIELFLKHLQVHRDQLLFSNIQGLNHRWIKVVYHFWLRVITMRMKIL